MAGSRTLGYGWMAEAEGRGPSVEGRVGENERRVTSEQAAREEV